MFVLNLTRTCVCVAPYVHIIRVYVHTRVCLCFRLKSINSNYHISPPKRITPSVLELKAAGDVCYIYNYTNTLNKSSRKHAEQCLH